MIAENADAQPNAENPLIRFAEAVGGAIVQPEPTLREVARREEWLYALVVVLLVSALTAAADVVATASGFRSIGGGTFGFEEAAAAGTLAVILAVNSALWSIVWGPVLWAIVTAVVFGSAYLLGGRGRFFPLLSVTGFAWIPQLLVAPVWIALDVVGYFSVGAYLLGFLMAITLSFLAFLWWVSLLAVAVHVSMGLSGARSLMAVVLPGIVAIFLGFVLLCVFIASFITVVSALT